MLNPVPQVSHSYPPASMAFRFWENVQFGLAPQKNFSLSLISEAWLKTQNSTCLISAAISLLDRGLQTCSLQCSRASLIRGALLQSLGKAHVTFLLLEDSSWHGTPQPGQGNATAFLLLSHTPLVDWCRWQRTNCRECPGPVLREISFCFFFG